MKFLAKNILTKIISLLILASVVFVQFSEKQWKEPEGVITSDVKGYYAYLPVIFIFDDIELKNPDKFNKNVWFQEDENGVRAIKYTCGMSILYSPFFLMAHMYVHLKGMTADGYSHPYKFALVMSSVFYLIISLIFLSKILLNYFNDSAVAITLAILFLGTNLFHYTASSMAYSHGYSFALISVFIYSSIMWLKTPYLKWAILIGISSGLMVLIRPIDMVFLLFLLLFELETFKNRIIFFIQNKWQVLVMIIGFFITILPQLIYFKIVSGSFLYYSYTGENFYFSKPHLIDSVLSFRNGWLIYSPLMIFSLIGFFFLNRFKTISRYTLLVIFLLYFYVISSWWCWWYAGFGNRAFINLYPFLSIPLASFVHYIIKQGYFQKILFSLVIICGITLNIFQNYQYKNSALHWDSMTKEAYWDSFGRLSPSQLFNSLLRSPVAEYALMGKTAVYEPKTDTLYKIQNDFEYLENIDSGLHQFWQKTNTFEGTGALSIPENQEYVFNQPINVKNANRVYITMWVKNSENIILVLSGNDSIPFYANANEVRKSKNGWEQLHLYAKIPENLNADTLIFYIWNKEFNSFCLDNFKASSMYVEYFIKEF
jgi:hypothetical protein